MSNDPNEKDPTPEECRANALDYFHAHGWVPEFAMDDLADVFFEKIICDYPEVIKSASLMDTLAKRFSEAAEIKRSTDKKINESIASELKLMDIGINAVDKALTN